MSRSSAYLLTISVCLLIALGFIMLLSAGAYSLEAKGDAMVVVRRQAVWLAVGVGVCVTMASMDYHLLRRFAAPLFVLTVILLALCFVPGVGKSVNGARRWLELTVPGVGTLQGQPSELAKIGVMIALAAWCSRFRNERKHFLRGFFLPLLLAALPIGLIAAEVDLGAASLIFIASVAMIYIAGSRVVYVAGMMACGAFLLWSAIQFIPNRAARVTAFLHMHDPDDGKLPAEIAEKNYQQRQSSLAFGNGGPAGLGIGNSRQKLGFLPLPHTDFVFAIVGEELGLAGTMGTGLLFLTFGLCGALISLHAPDRFGKLLGFGLVCLIMGQAAINIGVATGVLPNKGMPLPFVSYGGTNLLSCLTAVGILLSIFRHGRDLAEDSAPVLQREKLTPAV